MLARRAGIITLCVLSLVVCVGLAWWQWQRFENGGTWQNLGYVLQWPLFGLFPAFMFWRLYRLRAQQSEPTPQPTTRPAVESAPEARAEPAPVGAERAESHRPPPSGSDKPDLRQDVRDDEDPEDEDPELAAYNRYLAQLNALDQQETR